MLVKAHTVFGTKPALKSLRGGLGSPEFLTINVIVALISVIILLSPGAKNFSVDSRLAERSPGLSPLLINRRQN